MDEQRIAIRVTDGDPPFTVTVRPSDINHCPYDVCVRLNGTSLKEDALFGGPLVAWRMRRWIRKAKLRLIDIAALQEEQS